MPSPACPICRKDAAPRRDNRSFPFCSPRCRAVDLGRWLGEEYRVGVQQAEEEEDAAPPVPRPGTGGWDA
jgi:endogenous inhibitor of DNA gyrase (YacG/DUF329 family)